MLAWRLTGCGLCLNTDGPRDYDYDSPDENHLLPLHDAEAMAALVRDSLESAESRGPTSVFLHIIDGLANSHRLAAGGHLASLKVGCGQEG